MLMYIQSLSLTIMFKPQYPSTHRNRLRHTVLQPSEHSRDPQRAARCCNTLQHTL